MTTTVYSEEMYGDNVCDIFSSLGYPGRFNIYDIKGAGRKACYTIPCRSLAFHRELNNYEGKVRHLKNSTEIVVFNWHNLCNASLKLLNKNFRCFNGVSYLKRVNRVIL